MSVSRQPPLLTPQLKRSRPPPQFQPCLQLNTNKSVERNTFIKKPSTEVPKKATVPVKAQVQVEQQKNTTQPAKEEDSQEPSKDRLSVLYSRLQEEAKKVRKWKMVTEMGLKQKEADLQEAKQTIDKQQKQILDIQLEKESLNSRIKDTAANQSELQKKIDSTREMCRALKEHTLHIEEAVAQGENDRVLLVQQNQSTLEEYNELAHKFTQLEQMQADNHAVFEAKLLKEKNYSQELKLQLLKLTKEKSEKITAMKEELAQCNTELDQSQTDLNSAEELISQLNGQKTYLEDNLSSMETQILSMKSDLEKYNGELLQKNVSVTITDEITVLNKDIEVKESDINTLKQEVVLLKENIIDIEKQHCEKVNEMEVGKQELKDTLQGTIDQLKTIEKELSISKDESLALMSKCGHLESSIQTLTDEKATILMELDTSNKDLKQLSEKHESVEHELSILKMQLEENQQLLVLKQQEKDDMETRLNQTLKEQEKTALADREELLSAQERISDENCEIAKKLESTQQKCTSLEAEIDLLTSKLNDTTNLLNTENQQLKGKIAFAESECVQFKNLTDELNLLIKDKEFSVTALSEEVNKLTLSNKEKDSVIDGLDNKQHNLESELMSKMEELSSLTEKLDSVTQQIKSLEKAKTDIELTLEQGAHDYEQTISNLKKEIVNYEKLLKISNSKEQELKAMMDAQDKELAITLEKFQVENKHIISSKDEELNCFKKHVLKEKESLMNKIKNLEELIPKNSAINEENNKLLKKIDDLQKRLKNMEDELTQLRTTSTIVLDKPVSVVDEVLPTQVTPSQQKLPLDSGKGPVKNLKQLSYSNRVPFAPRASSTPINPRVEPYSTGRTPASTGRIHTGSIMDRKKVRDEDSPDRNIPSENEPSYKKFSRSLVTPKRYKTSNRKPGLKQRNKSLKKDSARKVDTGDNTDKLSWFDLDPVFGFPSED